MHHRGGPVNTDHRSGWPRVKGWTVLWTRHNRRPATSGLGQAQMWPNTGAVTSPPRSVPAWSRTNGVLFVSRYDFEHPFSRHLTRESPSSNRPPLENSRNSFEEFRARAERIEGIFELNRGISLNCKNLFFGEREQSFRIIFRRSLRGFESLDFWNFWKRSWRNVCLFGVRELS